MPEGDTVFRAARRLAGVLDAVHSRALTISTFTGTAKADTRKTRKLLAHWRGGRAAAGDKKN